MSSSKAARVFSCTLLAIQFSVFGAAATGFFEQPAFVAFLLPTLIANMVATAFQFTGKFAWEVPAPVASPSNESV